MARTCSIRLHVTAMILASMACGDGEGPPRTVTVTQQNTYFTEVGTSTTASPNDVGSITALASNGGALPATATGPGTWSIPAVPAGPFTLAVGWSSGGTSFVQTSASAIDLGQDVGGRTDVQWATSSTPASLHLSNLSPWVTGDTLQIYSWGARFWDRFAPETLASGATMTTTETLDLYSDAKSSVSRPKPLLTSSDEVYLVQYRAGAVAGTSDTYWQGVSWAATTGISITNGTAVTLAAAFAPTPKYESIDVDWKTSQFEPLLSGLQYPNHRLSVLAVPIAPTLPSAFFHSASLNLLDLFLPASVPVADRSYTALTYGTFLPAQYTEVRLARFYGLVPRFAPGSKTGQWFEQYVDRYDSLPAVGPIIPVVGPIRSPAIAGRDALASQIGVGVAPVMSWTAPSLGVPTRYRVHFLHLYVPAGQTTTAISTVATLDTAATQVTVPGGVLTPGQTYLAAIESISMQGDDVERAPYRVGVPRGSAGITTQTFVP